MRTYVLSSGKLTFTFASDKVSIRGFLAFLAWVFAASVMLVVAMRRGTAFVPQTVA